MIPLLTAAGCAGVLAIELHLRSEQSSVCAMATIVAAVLAQFVSARRTELSQRVELVT